MVSIARKTLNRAKFFNAQAELMASQNRERFQHFIETAIIFGRSVTFHLQKEFSKKADFNVWYELKRNEMASNSVCKFLLDKRNYILKEGPLAITLTITASVNETAVVSAMFEAEVIRAWPWYRRSAKTICGDFCAKMMRPIFRWRRQRQISKRRAKMKSKVSDTVSDQLHFEDPEWRDRPATDVILEYLDYLEEIVTEAEKRFANSSE